MLAYLAPRRDHPGDGKFWRRLAVPRRLGFSVLAVTPSLATTLYLGILQRYQASIDTPLGLLTPADRADGRHCALGKGLDLRMAGRRHRRAGQAGAGTAPAGPRDAGRPREMTEQSAIGSHWHCG